MATMTGRERLHLALRLLGAALLAGAAVTPLVFFSPFGASGCCLPSCWSSAASSAPSCCFGYRDELFGAARTAGYGYVAVRDGDGNNCC